VVPTWSDENTVASIFRRCSLTVVSESPVAAAISSWGRLAGLPVVAEVDRHPEHPALAVGQPGDVVARAGRVRASPFDLDPLMPSGCSESASAKAASVPM
jgi:hypothetical protein